MRLFLVSIITIFAILYFVSSPVYAKESNGTNFSTNCNQNNILYSIQNILCSFGFTINQFVEFTPNILNSRSDPNTKFGGIAYKEYKDGTEYIAISLVPVFLFICIMLYIGEASVGRSGVSMHDLLVNTIFAIFLILLSPYILSYLITFVNVLDKFIITNLIGVSSGNLFTLILGHFTQFSIFGLFENVIKVILYIALILALFIFSLEFIVRFILLWILILLFPIFIIFSLFPIFQGMFRSITLKIIELLFIQPAFLIGISIFVLIVNSTSITGIPQFLLGIITLYALSLIPFIFSGSLHTPVQNLSDRLRWNIYSTIQKFLEHNEKS